MSAQDCAERVRSLAQRIDELRGRASELEEATAGEPSLEVRSGRLQAAAFVWKGATFGRLTTAFLLRCCP
jgi:hypothetical protein